MTSKKAKPPVKGKSSHNLTKYTPALWEPAFLAGLREYGVVMKAIEGLGINRRSIYERRDTHPEFAQAWLDAKEDFADKLELEVFRRAHDGIEKGIYHQGVLMATETQYSDALLSQAVKAKRPDEYGDKLTLKLDPSWLAVLKRHGLTPLQAMEQLINALDEVDVLAGDSGVAGGIDA